MRLFSWLLHLSPHSSPEEDQHLPRIYPCSRFTRVLRSGGRLAHSPPDLAGTYARRAVRSEAARRASDFSPAELHGRAAEAGDSSEFLIPSFDFNEYSALMNPDFYAGLIVSSGRCGS